MGRSSITPDFSIIVPSLGETDYLNCLLSSIEQYGRHRYEVLIHVYPRARLPLLLAYNFPVILSADDTPGMGHASNVALDRARGEWIMWLADDVVFLPDTDAFGDRLQEHRVMSWTLLEPLPGSFEPPVPAGRSPKDYNAEMAAEAGRQRLSPSSPGKFFGHFMFHRSLLTPDARWVEDQGYATSDIDFQYRLYLEHEHVAFGQLGLTMYHFVQGSITRNPALRLNPDEAQRLFIERFGITTGEAYVRLNRRGAERWG